MLQQGPSGAYWCSRVIVPRECFWHPPILHVGEFGAFGVPASHFVLSCGSLRPPALHVLCPACVSHLVCWCVVVLPTHGVLSLTCFPDSFRGRGSGNRCCGLACRQALSLGCLREAMPCLYAVGMVHVGWLRSGPNDPMFHSTTPCNVRHMPYCQGFLFF
jgi:hypothetical protein